MGIRILAATVMAASSMTAIASGDGLDFNNLTLHYTYSEAEAADGDGFGAELFYNVWDNVYLQTAYSSRELENDAGATAEIDFLSFGAGYAYPLVESGKYQVFGGLSYEMLDLGGRGASGSQNPDSDNNDGGDDGGGGFDPIGAICEVIIVCPGAQTKSFNANGTGDTSGFGAHVGLRGEVYTNLELAARYQYRAFDDEFPGTGDDAEQILGLNLAYRFGQWAAVLNYDNYNTLELDEIYAGIRYDFAKE